MISLAEPVLGHLEKQALNDVVESGWLTMGERVAAFEKAFASLHHCDEAIAVGSCTAGLHLALAALGIEPGDEVLVPSLTFVATVNAVLYVGATPVFVDIESLREPHLSLEYASRRVTEKTRAVVVMHYGGYPVDVEKWSEFAGEQGIYLVEDAAHAPGCRTVGERSDVTAFSFFSNKNMTTGEGGMVLARDPAVRRRVRAMRSHGMTSTTLDRHKGHAHSYDVPLLGFNYRMDELRAAVGSVQLENLNKWNARRRDLSDHYRKLLAKACPEVVIPFTEETETVAHLMPVLLPEGGHREKIMDGLRNAGIQSSIHYPPVHGFSHYRNRFPGVALPMTERFSSLELSLPLHPSMTESDVAHVVGSLAALVKSDDP